MNHRVKVLVVVSIIIMPFLIFSIFIPFKKQPYNTLIDNKKRQLNIAGNHAPIDINGNGELDAFCSGLGTDGLSWSTAHRIENYTIDGQGSGYPIRIRNTDRYLIIRNCTLKNSGGITRGGIDLYNSSNVWIANSTMINNGYGIKASTQPGDFEENLIISGNNISKNYNGIGGDYFNKTHIYNNNITDNTNAALIFQDLQNSIIEFNNFSNNQYGLTLFDTIFDSKHNRILYNNFSRQQRYDISLDLSINTTLHYNIMERGIDFGESSTSTIEELGSYNITLSNKISGKSVYYYVNRTGLSSNNLINAGQVILINCNNSKFLNLNISNTVDAINQWFCVNNTFQGIFSTNNMGAGIKISLSNNITVWNSTFLDSDYGIYIQHNSKFNNISENVINSSNYHGIRLYISNFNFISRNNITYNDDYGIYLLGAKNNTIYANNCSFNEYGIYISGTGTSNTIWMNWLCNNSNRQAADNDNDGNNKWDNGTVGNYWGDYQKRYPLASHDGLIWDTPYSKFGAASSEDRYPLVIPLRLNINHPENVTYEFGSKNNIITWIIVDTKVSNPIYATYRNGAELDNKSWASGDLIPINIDGLAVGVYNFTIVAVDGLGEIVTDEVNITVTAPSGGAVVEGDDDNDDDDGKTPVILGYDIYILIGFICVISLILIRRYDGQKKPHRSYLLTL